MIRRRLLAAAALVAPLLLIAGSAAAAPANADYDPLDAARVRAKIGNVEAGIPPQCYAKTGPANPCYVCHTAPHGANQADDAELQQRYDFSPLRHTNPWSNLFVDRRAATAAIPDADILAWARSDNYTPLRLAATSSARPDEYRLWLPDLDLALGFDDQGFARDGSQWRAFRYKPFPGAFWPTNGSADEVMIRLPPALREDADGRPSREVYRANLAIVEALIATPADAAIDRAIEPVDERAAGLDLDGDGGLGVASRLRGLPPRYAGRSDARPRRGLYPPRTEFLHTLRYLDPQQPDYAARRLKELRYSIKAIDIDDSSIAAHYAEDAREKITGGRPHYSGNALTGQSNDFGWTLTGYIEDAQGRLRLQTREEQLACMGCHTGIGASVDQSFALARKLPGAGGWGLQTLAGQRDRPRAGRNRGEYAEYFERVGGSDDYRANTELLARYFDHNGKPDAARLARVDAALGLRGLLLPSPQRALALNKAYREVVREQSYTLGRDAVLAPLDQHAHRRIDAVEPAPAAAQQRYDDALPWLDWDRELAR